MRIQSIRIRSLKSLVEEVDNIRNAYTNQFNNPLRQIKKYQRGKVRQMQLPFPVSTSQLTERIQAGIDYRKGTSYETDL